MVIDEINRANLPKVLGELLFLFEYRDEQVPTQYRPDDPFELPKDLWFIGTMNTADRSIALIDAALRRRFHFVPFFPNHGPMAGLLGRWLESERRTGLGRRAGRAWSTHELEERLGGPHLQLGASHFMQQGLDEARLRDDLEVQHRTVHRGPVLRRRGTDRRVPLRRCARAVPRIGRGRRERDSVGRDGRGDGIRMIEIGPIPQYGAVESPADGCAGQTAARARRQLP